MNIIEFLYQRWYGISYHWNVGWFKEEFKKGRIDTAMKYLKAADEYKILLRNMGFSVDGTRINKRDLESITKEIPN